MERLVERKLRELEQRELVWEPDEQPPLKLGLQP